MAKYLLAHAGGMGFLSLVIGLSPVQALPDRSQKDLSSLDQLQKSQDAVVSPLPSVSPSFLVNPPISSGRIGQVTSVSQLSDVQPTDWAFTALQSLVERYGCIAGYPDRTYRGQRAMTRYEFAAGLNACLDKINEIISSGLADKVSKEDLAALQRLQEEFAAELAALRGRVDQLEAKTAQLEAQQFSTTTKLSGEAIIAAIGATGGAPDQDDPGIILVNRLRLNFSTSFTGKDLLITGLQSHNFMGGVDGQGSLQESLGLASPLLSASSARTSFEPQFPGVNVNTLESIGANSVQLYKLLYIFPVADKLTMFAGTAAETSDAFPAITPFYGEGSESISRFASLNPVMRVSGGTSGTGLASAVGFIYNISPSVDWRALYASVNASLPEKSPIEALPGVSTTPLGGGLFSGSTIFATQLTFNPNDNLDIGLNYANSYHEINILGTGLSSADIGSLAGVSAGTPVKLNSFGATVNWRLSPQISLSGYGAAIFVNDASNAVDASTTLTSWMAGLHFSDLFKSGNIAIYAWVEYSLSSYSHRANGKSILTRSASASYNRLFEERRFNGRNSKTF
jgi:hypothetical protein